MHERHGIENPTGAHLLWKNHPESSHSGVLLGALVVKHKERREAAGKSRPDLALAFVEGVGNAVLGQTFCTLNLSR